LLNVGIEKIGMEQGNRFVNVRKSVGELLKIAG
jgi:hypothetical protein